MPSKAPRSVALDDDVLDVLRASRVEGDRLWLPDAQLDRALYERVAKALARIGGKWNRKDRSHVFPVPAGDAIADAIASGRMLDRIGTLQFFQTPPEIADRLVAFIQPRDADRVLEPSAGHGAIVGRIPIAARIVAVEIDEANVDVLHAAFGGWGRVDVRHGDFAELAPTLGQFDAVVMNPPFTGGQDVEHVRAAFSLLRPGGRLAAVVSESPFFRSDKRSVAFRAWLEEIGADVETLPAGAFKASGTGVNARLVFGTRG